MNQNKVHREHRNNQQGSFLLVVIFLGIALLLGASAVSFYVLKMQGKYTYTSAQPSGSSVTTDSNADIQKDLDSTTPVPVDQDLNSFDSSVNSL